MRHYVLLLAFVSVLSNAPTHASTLQQIQTHLQSLYTPQGRPGGLRTVTGDEPFAGDCKDYYMAAMHQLLRHGHAPTAAIGRTRDTGIYHIMACAEEGGDLWCLDNTEERIISRRAARARYEGLQFRRYEE